MWHMPGAHKNQNESQSSSLEKGYFQGPFFSKGSFVLLYVLCLYSAVRWVDHRVCPSGHAGSVHGPQHGLCEARGAGADGTGYERDTACMYSQGFPVKVHAATRRNGRPVEAGWPHWPSKACGCVDQFLGLNSKRSHSLQVELGVSFVDFRFVSSALCRPCLRLGCCAS